MKLSTIPFADVANTIALCAEAGITPLLLGPPGIGKTASSYAAAERLSIRRGVPHEHRIVELTSFSEVDVRGYLIPKGEDSMFTRPEFWPDADSKYGLITLDEFAQVEAPIQKAIAPLILERRIGNRVLDKGWAVCAFGNRMQDNSGVADLLDHMTNRMMIAEVLPPTADDMMEYLIGKGYEPHFAAFAKLRYNLFNEKPSEPGQPFLTPRSLEAVARLQLVSGVKPSQFFDSRLNQSMVQGLIGQGAGIELAAVVKLFGRLPSYDAIIANPDTAMIPTELDLAFAAITMIATNAKIEDADAVVRYIRRFDDNMSVVAVSGLVKRNVAFSRCAAFVDWATNNVEVLVRMRRLAGA